MVINCLDEAAGGGGGNYIYLYNFPLPACAHLILAVFQTVHSFNDIVATIFDIDYQLLFLKLDLFSYLLQLIFLWLGFAKKK